MAIAINKKGKKQGKNSFTHTVSGDGVLFVATDHKRKITFNGEPFKQGMKISKK